MDKNSSKYILIYSTVLVVVVAFVLSFTSMALKDRKRINVENEMKEAILLTIGIGENLDKVDNKAIYIQEQYDKYIVSSFAVKVNGDRVVSDDPDYAFNILLELKKEYDKPEDGRELPVFVSECDDGKERYIIPLWGSGLWGPIWGYMAFEDDLDTIFGAVFDHSGETPGLGAEINTSNFEHQFTGKRIYKNDNLVGITVMKGIGSSANRDDAVDGISGGTITSRGVQDMIINNLKEYAAFFEIQKAESNNIDVPKEPSNEEKTLTIENNE